MTDKAMNEVHTKQSETEPSRNPEYLRLTTTELEKILKDHKQWLESKEREGKPIELQGADLQGADLSNRDLSKTRLEGVIFGDASMSGASLREANLHGTDLSEVRGLLAGQLAGANLSATKLPKDIRTFEGPLQFIDEGSKNARKLFFGMLAGCAYTVLTLANTTDARLLTNSASLRLPIIGTEIPIVGFFITTPLLLLGIYLYFQIYMQRLWESLSKLPAIFPDGRSLDEKAYPWLLVGYISAHVRWLKENRPSLSHLQTTISIFLSWWVVPSTLVLLWARYLVRHDWFGTSLHIIVVGISCGAGIYFQRSARRTLRGKVAVRKHRRQFKTLLNATLYAAIFLLFGAMFYLISREGIEDTPSQYIDMSPAKAEGKALQWDSYAKIFSRDFFRANLVETDVSTRPSEWTEKNVDLSLVKGASLRGVDLRHANALRAFLINADLRDTDLRGAILNDRGLLERTYFQFENLM